MHRSLRCYRRTYGIGSILHLGVLVSFSVFALIHPDFADSIPWRVAMLTEGAFLAMRLCVAVASRTESTVNVLLPECGLLLIAMVYSIQHSVKAPLMYTDPKLPGLTKLLLVCQLALFSFNLILLLGWTDHQQNKFFRLLDKWSNDDNPPYISPEGALLVVGLLASTGLVIVLFVWCLIPSPSPLAFSVSDAW